MFMRMITLLPHDSPQYDHASSWSTSNRESDESGNINMCGFVCSLGAWRMQDKPAIRDATAKMETYL